MRMVIFLSICVLAKSINNKGYKKVVPDILALVLLIVFALWDFLEFITRLK